MKISTGALIILLASSLLFSSQVFGQRKSKVDPKDAQIDTLTKANQALTLNADSLSAELVKYLGVYTTIKEKVIHYNFDPTRTSYLIDSLQASRDSAFARLSPAPLSADSIAILKNENMTLRAAIDKMTAIGAEEVASLTAAEIEKAKAISNLKELKDLLDAKIITEAEFIAAKKKYLDKL